MNAQLEFRERVRQPIALIDRLLEQVIRQAQRSLSSNARQPCQFIGEIIND